MNDYSFIQHELTEVSWDCQVENKQLVERINNNRHISDFEVMTNLIKKVYIFCTIGQTESQMDHVS